MFKKKSTIQICNEHIRPGETLSLALPLPELYSCVPSFMPLKVIRGKEEGPTLLVFAAINGQELNGSQIINKLIHHSLVKKIKGTLIAVPVVNVYGLLNKSKYLPGNIELDSCFPGSKLGNHAERLAHLFLEEIFSLADYSISLETGPINHSAIPITAVDFKNEKTRALADVFSTPVIGQMSAKPGSLKSFALAKKKNIICYRAGEALKFDNHAIKFGLNGILRVMEHLQMIHIDKPTHRSKLPPSYFVEESFWTRAPKSGISNSKVKLGHHVKKGEDLTVISDPFATREPIKFKSAHDGIIVGINNLPLVHEGEALFEIATFPQTEKVKSHLKDWKSKGETLIETYEK